jgi:ankyrin repeat protein
MQAAVELRRAIVGGAKRGALEEVRRLVQRDRGLVDAVYGGMSPLTAAARVGHVEVVRYLLDEGAGINLRPVNDFYRTALGWACSEGRLQVVALLLARGASTTPSGDGRTPLMYAAQEGHTDIVDLLLAHREGEQLERQIFHGRRTALHFACFKGHAGVVMLLLGAGADPHVVDHYGRTPLRYAVTKGHAECEALLQVSIEHRVSAYVLGWHGGHFPHDVRLSAAFATVHLPRPQTYRSGSGATSSPRPAASVTPLPHCA